MSFILPVILSLGVTALGSTMSIESNLGNYFNSNNRYNLIEDQYISNDSYDSAIDISPNDYYKLNDYEVNVNGKLTYDGYHDFDYYYFTILADSYIAMNCHNENNQNFECAILGYTYNVQNNCAYHNLENIFDGYSDSSNKYYEQYFKPGTYFIYLRGKEKEDTNYELNLYVEKIKYNMTMQKNSLLESNLNGVIWINDIVPGNNVPLFNLSNNTTYYKFNEQNLHMPDYALDDLRIMSNSSQVHIATYFIKDPLLRYALYNIFSEISKELTTNLIKNQKIKVELELKYDIAKSTINITGTIANLFIKNPIIKIGVNLFKYLNLFALDACFKLLLPNCEIMDTLYYGYIQKMVGYLDFENSFDNENFNEESLKKCPNNEIIQIPVYCSLNKKNDNEFYYTYNDTILEILKADTLIWKDDTYNFNQSTNEKDYYYSTGKFYAITSTDDISEYKNIKLINDDYTVHYHNYNSYKEYDSNKHIAYCMCGRSIFTNHISKNHHCSYCGIYVDEHDYHYSYKWLNTSQHIAKCICGKTVTQGHIVSSGGKTCLLCGGRADIGFIGPDLVKNYNIHKQNNEQQLLLQTQLIELNYKRLFN